MTNNNEFVAKPETWDAVAETYSVALEDGDLQLANNIEELLKKRGLKPGDSLIEMGCGSGHLSLCLAQKGYKVTLLDFSPVALKKAKETFEKYGAQGEFILGDLFHLDESVPVCDYAWNSGVMEHFGDEEIMTLMRNIGKHARKGVLYLVPNTRSIAYLLMRARLMADEKWLYGEEFLRNDYEDILHNLGYETVIKEYVSTAAISAYQIWKAEKEKGYISNLYKLLAEEKMLPKEEGYLVSYYASEARDISETESVIGSTVQDTKMFDLVAKKVAYEEQKVQIEQYIKEIQELKNANADFEKANSELIKTKSELELTNDQLGKVNENLKNSNENLKNSNENLKNSNENLKNSNENLKKLNEILKKLNEDLKNSNDRLNSERSVLKEEMKGRECELEEINKSLYQELLLTQQNYQMALAVLQQKNEYMMQAQEMCHHYATGKLMKMNHYLFRVKNQYMNGSKEDKAEFKAWRKGRRKGTNKNIGAGAIYNPWMVVSGKLSQGIACVPTNDNTEVSTLITDEIKPIENKRTLSLETKKILKQNYTKYDVIILSVIDYNFRHQRPQHFATRFASNDHRVFYVNANFVRPDSISTEQENLYVVDFSCDNHNAIYTMNGTDTLDWMKQKFDWLIYSQGIRDAIVIVDYPNWVYGAEFIREKYGFKIVTDYMDDYTGFLGTAEDFLKNNCIRLLQVNDTVVASSQFLYDVACKHTDAEKITIVRNGTEVDHFYQAIGMETLNKERKVIGYYGAVAHWFAWEKVCYLAEHFPECDVVIVGDVTEYRDKLEKYRNIKLLGEKPYKELPKYLADFDVCLIPFDTSTDLIKATNPVKFYEYLSAGKKVVATEIPELMPFRDEYVYMSNDDENFAEYVKLCLDETDTLKGKEECIEFARENDWQKRYECFAKACKEQIPLISIVVLTYNNLEYNRQCIESIINKTAYANYELIIVDNQSTDGTVDYLKELEQKEMSNVKVIFNEENFGFAGGNNVGMEVANGKYVLLLNNDTVVTRGWLTALSKHLENNAEYGMCNPVTNSIGNESMIPVQYQNVEEMHEFAYMATATSMGEEYTDVDRLPLFCTIIRKEIIDNVGMLDEAYKVGMFEDDDFTESVKNANYKILIADDAFIHHVNNGSFKKLDDEEYKKIFDANKAIYEKKWNKKWTMPKYRDGVTAECNINMKI